MKGIVGILSIALLGMMVGGLIGIRESASQAFQPDWYTPAVSYLYIGLNLAALFALVRSAQYWESKLLFLLGLVFGWFSPAMIVAFDYGSEWIPHLVWGLMILVPSSILLDLLLHKRVNQAPAYKY